MALIAKGYLKIGRHCKYLSTNGQHKDVFYFKGAKLHQGLSQ